MEANHNLEIISTRKGGFGGSDAKLFYKIGSKGLESLSNTDKKRIRVAKGLDEYKPIFVNEAMQRGHDFEDWYEENQLSIYDRFERELKLSKKIAKSFDTFFHADFCRINTLECRELKCVQDIDSVSLYYAEQLQWQIMISGFGCVFLVVCDSNEDTFEKGLQPIRTVEENNIIINKLYAGIKLLDEAWDSIDLTIGEEWEESDLLFFDKPEVVAMYDYLSEIKALESRAEEQKAKVLQIMLDNNIKSLKSDLYNITLMPESTTNTFDKEKMLSEHPEINEQDYIKSSPKKSYIKVTLL